MVPYKTAEIQKLDPDDFKPPLMSRTSIADSPSKTYSSFYADIKCYAGQ